MLVKPPIEELLPKVESRYTLAMLVAKRTRQLVDGAQPMVDSESTNLVTLACEEIAADQVICVTGIFSPVVPLRPEIEEARRLAREQAANQASLDSFPDLMDIPKGADADELTDLVPMTDTDEIVEEDVSDEIVEEDVSDDIIADISEDITEDITEDIETEDKTDEPEDLSVTEE